MTPGSVPKIIQAYKAAVTRRIRMDGCPDFEWQPRNFDPIIRNKKTLERHRRYILENPNKWTNAHRAIITNTSTKHRTPAPPCVGP